MDQNTVNQNLYPGIKVETFTEPVTQFKIGSVVTFGERLLNRKCGNWNLSQPSLHHCESTECRQIKTINGWEPTVSLAMCCGCGRVYSLL